MAVMGCIFGSIGGVMLGVMDGAALGILSYAYFRLRRDNRTFRALAVSVTVVTTSVGAGVLADGSVWSVLDYLETHVVVVALIASISAAYASSNYVDWYVFETDRAVREAVHV